MSQKRKHKRKLKNYWINPKFQTRYIVTLLSVSVVLVGVLGTVFYRYLEENYTLLVNMSPMRDEIKVLLMEELAALKNSIIMSSIGYLCFVFGFGTYFSHRTAGPLYAFMRVFREIKNGKQHTRLHLRPGDDFHDVAEEFNGMMNELVGEPQKPQDKDKDNKKSDAA